jgi:hypothetical protein
MSHKSTRHGDSPTKSLQNYKKKINFAQNQQIKLQNDYNKAVFSFDSYHFGCCRAFFGTHAGISKTGRHPTLGQMGAFRDVRWNVLRVVV